MLFIAFILALVWAGVVSYQLDNAISSHKELVREVNGHLSAISDVFKTVGKTIQSDVSKLENRLMSIITSKTQSLKDKVKNIESALGDVRGAWVATGTEIVGGSPQLPTVAERIQGIEEVIGVSFKHSVEENRGYVPSRPATPQQFVEVGPGVPCAEYPVKNPKSKK